jgi:hypothetical protein
MNEQPPIPHARIVLILKMIVLAVEEAPYAFESELMQRILHYGVRFAVTEAEVRTVLEAPLIEHLFIARWRQAHAPSAD